jgi:hypothetical protein
MAAVARLIGCRTSGERYEIVLADALKHEKDR